MVLNIIIEISLEVELEIKRGSSWSWSYGSFIQLPVQSVPITTNVVNSNPVHGEVYSIQHYVILSMTCGRSIVFSGYSGFFTNKTDLPDITEMLLKVALNTINQPKINLPHSSISSKVKQWVRINMFIYILNESFLRSVCTNYTTSTNGFTKIAQDWWSCHGFYSF